MTLTDLDQFIHFPRQVVLMSATMNSEMFASYFMTTGPTAAGPASFSAEASAHPAASASASSTIPYAGGDAGWGPDDGGGGGGGGWGAGGAGAAVGGWGHAQPPQPPQPQQPRVRECPIVEIPGFTHPVEQMFLEDAVEMTGIDLREVAVNAANGGGGGRGGGRGGYGGGGGGGGGRDWAAQKRRKRLKHLENQYEDRLEELKAAAASSAEVMCSVCGVNGWTDGWVGWLVGQAGGWMVKAHHQADLFVCLRVLHSVSGRGRAAVRSRDAGLSGGLRRGGDPPRAHRGCVVVAMWVWE